MDTESYVYKKSGLVYVDGRIHTTIGKPSCIPSEYGKVFAERRV